MLTLEEALQKRFSAGAAARSAAYRAGFASRLQQLMAGKPMTNFSTDKNGRRSAVPAVQNPYTAGTAEADAFWSGEDHAINYFATLDKLDKQK